MVAYINTIDDLILVLDDFILYKSKIAFNQIQSAYNYCLQLESEIENTLAKILLVDNNKINLVYSCNEILLLSKTLISKIKTFDYEKDDEIYIYDIYNSTSEQNTILYEYRRILSKRNLSVTMAESLNEENIEVSGNLEQIRKKFVDKEIEIPVKCVGFDPSLSAVIFESVTLPIVEKCGIGKYLY